MFYEIPVVKPWGKDDEYNAYQNTVEQVVLGDKLGFHSFWAVAHPGQARAARIRRLSGTV